MPDQTTQPGLATAAANDGDTTPQPTTTTTTSTTDATTSSPPPTVTEATNGCRPPDMASTTSEPTTAAAPLDIPSTQPLPPTSTTTAQMPPIAAASSSAPSPAERGRFICGVVEGFYGRPWTTEQRKDLFGKLRRCGMDSYVYAPKDDYKHRAYWRELYTVEEGEHLGGLIAAAKEHGITFYYALSPGLDMVYSSGKEVATLKRKLEQVSQFGCEAFALLFDDIESEMTNADKEAFQTFAQAQVTVTNEIYHHLRAPRFLFCPTQYCGTRAVPTVPASDYLRTLGAQLSLDIDILWTGPRVISKELSQEQLQEVTDVLRRPPVIWDNIHANDYDQKRVFLGPYAGRSPGIIPQLRGVLTNPNCEFHANAIAIRTLALWSRCRRETRGGVETRLSAADVRLERGDNDDGDDGDLGEETAAIADAAVAAEEGAFVGALAANDATYHPRVALRQAIRDWLPEFFVRKAAYGPMAKPHPAAVAVVMPVLPIIPSVNTCMSLTTTTTTTTTTAQSAAPASGSEAANGAAAIDDFAVGTTVTTAAVDVVVQQQPLKVAAVNTTQLQALAEVCSVVTGTDPLTLPTVVMNSLVSSTTIVTNTALPSTHPIASASIELALPAHPVPVSSIGLPIANVDGTPYQLETTAADDAEMKANGASGDETSPIECDVDEPMEIGGGGSGGMSSKPASIGGDSDVVMVEITTPPSALESTSGGGSSSSSSASSSSSMQIEASANEAPSPQSSFGDGTDKPATAAAAAEDDADDLGGADLRPITADDLSLMCDLFYLPFEHGTRALRLLNEFNWLKTNAVALVRVPASGGSPEAAEWLARAQRFYALGRSVLVLAKKLAVCENRELAYELFAYVWDVAGVVTQLSGFVRWLALGRFPTNINAFTQGSYTWFSKGWRETFCSGDQEPWVFRGGLTADLQRLIPVDSGNDLFLYKLPDAPTTSFPTIRPYRPGDERRVYAMCHRTCRDGSDCTELFPPGRLQSIPADRLIGPFVTLTPELCLVAVDGAEIVGYACAALDAKQFYRQQEMCWMPAMCEKYPLALIEAGAASEGGKSPAVDGGAAGSATMTPAAMESIRHFHHFRYDCPGSVLATHPSIMTCCVLKEQFIADQSMAKRLVTVLLAALRSSGSAGVHACINPADRFLHQFYSKLGFVELPQGLAEPTGGNKVYMGRNF